MRPSELKSLRGFLAEIREDIASFRDVFKERSASIANQKIAQQQSNEEEWRKTQEILSRPRRTDPDEQTKSEANLRRRHWQNFGMQGALMLGTWLAFAAAAIYAELAYKQWCTMNNTYVQIQKQTKLAGDAAYDACLNAQAAQATFLQIQKDSIDSHATALAVVKQTEAQIEAAKAIITIFPKMPSPQDDLKTASIDVHYSLRNAGKSSANTVDLKVKAVLLSDKEVLHISKDKFDSSWGKFFGPGDEVPPKPTTPEEKPAPIFTVVIDSAGKAIDRSSPEAKRFFSGTGNEEVFFYGNLDFTDFAGRHKWRFCVPLHKTDPDIRSLATKNETVCGTYNHVDNRYSAMPKIDTNAPIDNAQISSDKAQPITCVKPKE